MNETAVLQAGFSRAGQTPQAENIQARFAVQDFFPEESVEEAVLVSSDPM